MIMNEPVAGAALEAPARRLPLRRLFPRLPTAPIQALILSRTAVALSSSVPLKRSPMLPCSPPTTGRFTRTAPI
jgi:hypothetical protein